jgi:hypothetical protein
VVRQDTLLTSKTTFYQVQVKSARSAMSLAVWCERLANKEVRVTEYEERSDRFMAIEDQYAGYTVYDQHYEKIGKVDDLFVDERDQPEYIGFKMGSSVQVPPSSLLTSLR